MPAARGCDPHPFEPLWVEHGKQRSFTGLFLHKRGVVLDIGDADGHSALCALLARADAS
ncbi:hypothetical protein GCM10022222_82210 [Amycolatopsis ultiminotia]|uniref:Uncharacterized protein n=1 Tax=Amycolatopsis ultiminotia TaxID=543629 RepID=A0ABP6YJT3_9PSEU